MKDNYSTQEIADILGVSVRTVQNYLSDLRKSLRKGTKYNYSVLKAISAVYDYKLNAEKRNKTKTSAEYDHIEYFTEEEYQEFHKRLIEYPLIRKHIETLENEIEYHKLQYDKLVNLHSDFIEAHKASLKNLEQRNFIEVKEKRLDK